MSEEEIGKVLKDYMTRWYTVKWGSKYKKTFNITKEISTIDLLKFMDNAIMKEFYYLDQQGE